MKLTSYTYMYICICNEYVNTYININKIFTTLAKQLTTKILKTLHVPLLTSVDVVPLMKNAGVVENS